MAATSLPTLFQARTGLVATLNQHVRQQCSRIEHLATHSRSAAAVREANLTTATGRPTTRVLRRSPKPSDYHPVDLKAVISQVGLDGRGNMRALIFPGLTEERVWFMRRAGDDLGNIGMVVLTPQGAGRWRGSWVRAPWADQVEQTGMGRITIRAHGGIDNADQPLGLHIVLVHQNDTSEHRLIDPGSLATLAMQNPYLQSMLDRGKQSVVKESCRQQDYFHQFRDPFNTVFDNPVYGLTGVYVRQGTYSDLDYLFSRSLPECGPPAPGIDLPIWHIEFDDATRRAMRDAYDSGVRCGVLTPGCPLTVTYLLHAQTPAPGASTNPFIW